MEQQQQQQQHQQIIIVAGKTAVVTKRVTTASILQTRCGGSNIYFALKDPLYPNLPEVRYCTGTYDEKHDATYRYLSRQLAKDEVLDEQLLNDLRLEESALDLVFATGEELNKRKAAGEKLGDVFKLIAMNATLTKYVDQDDFVSFRQ